jgi:hypothetical protein
VTVVEGTCRHSGCVSGVGVEVMGHVVRRARSLTEENEETVTVKVRMIT